MLALVWFLYDCGGVFARCDGLLDDQSFTALGAVWQRPFGV